MPAELHLFQRQGIAATACIGFQNSLGTSEDNHLERFTVVTFTGGGTTGGESAQLPPGRKINTNKSKAMMQLAAQVTSSENDHIWAVLDQKLLKSMKLALDLQWY